MTSLNHSDIGKEVTNNIENDDNFDIEEINKWYSEEEKNESINNIKVELDMQRKTEDIVQKQEGKKLQKQLEDIEKLEKMKVQYQKDLETLEKFYPEWFQIVYRAEWPHDISMENQPSQIWLHYSDVWEVVMQYGRDLQIKTQKDITIYALVVPKKRLENKFDINKYIPQIKVKEEVKDWKIAISSILWVYRDWKCDIKKLNDIPPASAETFLGQYQHTRDYLALKSKLWK